MNEMQLKYGCNPNQKPSRVFMENGDLPFEVICGRPGYINLLDALNGWQLVKDFLPQLLLNTFLLPVRLLDFRCLTH